MTINFVSILQIHLISFFMISAVLKIISFPHFIQLVTAYPVLPRRAAQLWGSIVPPLELAGCLLLLRAPTQLYGGIILVALLLSFLYAVLKARRTGSPIRCGCYGRFLDSRADQFTIFKIIYFLLLLMLTIPWLVAQKMQHSVLSFSIGLSWTLLFFLLQKIWGIHRRTMDQLS